jgi:hypothetical protein
MPGPACNVIFLFMASFIAGMTGACYMLSVFIGWMGSCEFLPRLDLKWCPPSLHLPSS